ncbi:MAG: sigma-70 family RNA polymerase sigma factor [Clostridiales bacterium]|nr:sigma-70 family RNA polymerase sigma factor [Clostridiales bacterium]
MERRGSVGNGCCTRDLPCEAVRSGPERFKAELDLLYRDNRYRLIVIANKLLRDFMESEDVVQEVFSDMLEASGRYLGKPVGELLLISCAAVRYRAIDRLRRAVRAPVSASIENWETVEAPGAGVDAGLLRDEEMALMRRLYGRLSERTRCIVEMKHLQVMGHREIAARLQISERTVESRLRRARLTLQKWREEADVPGKPG